MFQCNNGKCISKYNICDFDNDCGDNSDESRTDGAFCGVQTCFFYAFNKHIQSNLLEFVKLYKTKSKFDKIGF